MRVLYLMKSGLGRDVNETAFVYLMENNDQGTVTKKSNCFEATYPPR